VSTDIAKGRIKIGLGYILVPVHDTACNDIEEQDTWTPSLTVCCHLKETVIRENVINIR